MHVGLHLAFDVLVARVVAPDGTAAMRVVSSAYLSLLIFLLAILIPACASSSPAFLILYSAYNLNKQGVKASPIKRDGKIDYTSLTEKWFIS